MAKIPGYLTVYKRFIGHPPSAIHAFMEEQAKQFTRPSLRVSVEYADGSKDDNFETFNPWHQVVEYSISPNPEDTYAIAFDRPGYNGGILFDFRKFSRKELRTELEKWFKAQDLSGPILKMTFHTE